jgi:hypothetical protein
VTTDVPGVAEFLFELFVVLEFLDELVLVSPLEAENKVQEPNRTAPQRRRAADPNNPLIFLDLFINILPFYFFSE